MKKGEEIVVDVTALSSEGKGIARLEDGFVIFTEKILPGDKALVRIRKKKSGYAEARLVELIEPSNKRVDPPCEYFGVCGGCKIQNLEYKEQLSFKTESVKNALERIGGFKDLIVPDAIGSKEIFFYRNKMEFSFSDDRWVEFKNAPQLDTRIGKEKRKKLIKEERNEEAIKYSNLPPPLTGGTEGGQKLEDKEDLPETDSSFSSPLTGGIEVGHEHQNRNYIYEKDWLRSRSLIKTIASLPYNPKLVSRAKELRKRQTKTEKRIWEIVKDLDVRVYRQRPIDNFIADFYCSEAKLVIEIDGDEHSKGECKIRDDERSRILNEAYGLEVIRFKNEEVLNDFEKVCSRIKEKIIGRTSPLTGGIEGGQKLEDKEDLPETDSFSSPLTGGTEGGPQYKDIENLSEIDPSFPSQPQEIEGSSKTEDTNILFRKGNLSSNSQTPLPSPLIGGKQLHLKGEERLENLAEAPPKDFALGLHVPRFHSKIIDIHRCYLQSEIFNGILNYTRDFFKSRGLSIYSTSTHSGYLRFLIIRQCTFTNDLMVNLMSYDYNEPLINEYSTGLLDLFPQVTTFLNSTTEKKAQVAFGENEHLLFGPGYITEKLTSAEGKEYSYKISPNSFFQTNSSQAQVLYNITAEYGEFNKNDNVLDLYCGAGSIGIFISDRVNKVLGVELIEDAINNANENKALNNINNIEFLLSDIKDFIESTNIKEYNKIVLDPPRSGLHPDICEILSNTDMERIVYVSCNPSTQARDLAIICSKGKYAIDRIQPVDMFPHTYHVENVISLKRL